MYEAYDEYKLEQTDIMLQLQNNFEFVVHWTTKYLRSWLMHNFGDVFDVR